MKRTNVNLTDADLGAIRIIRERYGLTNTTAAIRLALRLTSQQGDTGMNVATSGAIKKQRATPPRQEEK